MINNIVIRCPNWVGDLVMSTPALRCLRQSFPKATISVIVRPAIKKVIENLPFFDDIIEYDPKGQDRGMYNYLKFILNLRKRRFDLAIALTSSFSSALLLFLSSIPVRTGYARNMRGFMLTHKKKPLREHGKIIPINKTQIYLGLCALLGCSYLDEKTELKTSASAEKWVDFFFTKHGLQQNDFIIVMIPGASFGPSKCWPEQSFASVADALIKEYGARVIIIPGPGETEIMQRIENQMTEQPVALGPDIIPLDRLMAIIKRSSLLITNDTGPRHFGVAFNKPIIVIMGPTDSRHTDCNLEKTVILRQEVDCAPCHLRECPTDHRCMTHITPAMVLDTAAEMTKKYGLVKK